MTGNSRFAVARTLIEEMYRSAVAASDPEIAVERHLQRDGNALVLNGTRWPVAGRVLIVGGGKAAVPMARAAERIGGELVAGGLVITKDGHAAAPPSRIDVVEAAHPIPDQRGVNATRRILGMVSDLDEDDIVLALISGGGSALLEAPKEGLTLDAMAEVTDLLLRAGAPIQDLNTVRRPLSRVKGGGLLQAAGGTPVLTLILSDVLGNDPQVIASGPTVPSPSSGEAALAVIDRYGMTDRVPAAVLGALDHQDEDDELAERSDDGQYAIVADNQTALDAASETVRSKGRRIEMVWQGKEGEASKLGIEWVRLCQGAAAEVDVLLGGGEATVTVRGDGVGGRNTEFALAAALELNSVGASDWVVASLATDGQDGPTGAAGAIADAETVRRALAAGVNPAEALARNDSLRVFEAAGGVLTPGPTGTNVNDLYIGVRVAPEGREEPGG